MPYAKRLGYGKRTRAAVARPGLGLLAIVLKHDAVEPSGMPVGLMPSVSYEQCSVALRSGDLLVVVSDGIVDGCNEAGESRKRSIMSWMERNRTTT